MFFEQSQPLDSRPLLLVLVLVLVLAWNVVFGVLADRLGD
jgi:hypothetical protein